MHPSLNPIEKHKSQIEKRISQLEHKFNKDRNPDVNGPTRRMRQHITDENKYNNAMALSKTMQVKGRNRGIGQIARVKKNMPHQTNLNIIQDALKQNKMRKNRDQRQQIQVKENKQQKIKQLEYMVRSLLEGQKVLERELHDLKAKNTKDQAINTTTFDQSTNQYSRPIHFTDSLQKTNKSEVNKDSSIVKKRQSINPTMNQSLLIAQNNVQIGASKQKRVSKKPSANINTKKKNFQQLYQQLKQKGRQDKRYIVQQEWKSRIWSEVESRVRQSDKQYKDTMHRNNKHEFEHLMSTFELQRKLKDDLISKVYQQCNDQIYK